MCMERERERNYSLYIFAEVYSAHTHSAALQLQAVSVHFILVWLKTLSLLSHCYYYYRRFKFLFVAFISLTLTRRLSLSRNCLLGMHHSANRIDTIFFSSVFCLRRFVIMHVDRYNFRCFFFCPCLSLLVYIAQFIACLFSMVCSSFFFRCSTQIPFHLIQFVCCI